MKSLPTFLLLAVVVVVLSPGLSRSGWAANICDETVPSNRIVDGIPAYAQCTDSNNGAVYSNNGVDTAITSSGSDWMRTQGSGGYQCTELAHRYLYFKWNIKNVPNGNAGVWCDGNIPSGLEKTTTPVHGDLIVFAPGSCGADSTTGHVAVVDVVNTNASVTFIEQNRAGRRSCAIDTAACFLHATNNNGATVDGGMADAHSIGDSLDALPDAASDSGNQAGSGGTTGSGGAGGSASQTNSGGASGAGGVSGSAVASTGGSGGATTANEPSSSSGGGCSCHISGGSARDANARLGIIAFLALLLVSRRRRLRR